MLCSDCLPLGFLCTCIIGKKKVNLSNCIFLWIVLMLVLIAYVGDIIWRWQKLMFQSQHNIVLSLLLDSCVAKRDKKFILQFILRGFLFLSADWIVTHVIWGYQNFCCAHQDGDCQGNFWPLQHTSAIGCNLTFSVQETAYTSIFLRWWN